MSRTFLSSARRTSARQCLKSAGPVSTLPEWRSLDTGGVQMWSTSFMLVFASATATDVPILTTDATVAEGSTTRCEYSWILVVEWAIFLASAATMITCERPSNTNERKQARDNNQSNLFRNLFAPHGATMIRAE